MWFIGVEVEQETSAPPPKKNPGSAPEPFVYSQSFHRPHTVTLPCLVKGFGFIMLQFPVFKTRYEVMKFSSTKVDNYVSKFAI